MAVPPTESVAVTLKVSVPEAVGVPVIATLVVPLVGTIRPGTWLVSLTVRLSVPVPLLAATVWL